MYSDFCTGNQDSRKESDYGGGIDNMDGTLSHAKNERRNCSASCAAVVFSCIGLVILAVGAMTLYPWKSGKMYTDLISYN